MILEMKLGSSLAYCLSSLRVETRRAFWSSLSSFGSPTISQSLWIVCLRSARVASRTFAMFSGAVLVDGCPERSSSSTDVCPFLKRLYHKTVMLLPRPLSPKASCSFRWVSASGFFNTETKFDANSLLLKIGHISCKKIRRITKT